jgi:CDP-6-deoxy-D-xylo-4-hexulose-3-dehydrase
MNNKIQLVKDTIDNKDVEHLIEWLKTFPKLTKGELTIKFEEVFSKWIGCKHSVFVNSGSSANLLMIYLLKYMGLLKNNKIAVPSLSWATDLSPVMQFDIEPVLVDCNLDNLSVDLEHLEAVFEEHKPDAFILVSVLGLSPDMDKILELCKRYNVILLEDNCESQGTKFNEVRLGNFGFMSSFSTYFGHTMSTIEGGMITTNDDKIYALLKQFRSHGWDRDLNDKEKEKLRSDWNIDNFSALYTFFVPGFNVRSTDLQAFIGLKQMEKVDDMISKRNENFKLFKSLLKDKAWFPKETNNSYTASFCIPVIFKNEKNKESAIKDFLDNDIECRPLICGSMGTQPFYTKKYGMNKLYNCNVIDSRGMYVPNHPKLTIDEIKLICDIIIKNDN